MSSSKESELPITPLSTLERRANRGSHDRALIDSILDEAFLCHVGVVAQGMPRVIPFAHVRMDDHVYLHGARANFVLGALAAGAPACLTVTLLDGLVFARSAFHHSMNYRSVVLYGAGAVVEDGVEKREALDALVEHMAPGRSHEAKAPDEKELRSTLVVRFPIVEGSAKVRVGPPVDDAELVRDSPCWAGELPLALVARAPRADPLNREHPHSDAVLRVVARLAPA